MIRLIFIISVTTLFFQCTAESNHSKMENKSLYGLNGKFVAKDGKGQELAQILLEASELMKKAEGCQLYVIGISKTNRDEVMVSEIWDTKEDHDNSLKIPGVRELIGKAIPLLNENPKKGTETEIIGGLGI